MSCSLRSGALSALFVSACFAGPPPPGFGEGCDGDSACDAGSVCVDRRCYRVCSATDGCAADEACLDGLCRAYNATCDAHEDCVEGWYCAGSGACTRKLPLGSACAEVEACASGLCADHVCCAAVCGVCQICDAAGQCAAVADAEDPDDECPGAAACTGGGECWALELGTSCGFDYQCASGWCADGTCCDARCDGPCEACASGVCADVIDAVDPDTCGSQAQDGACLTLPCICDGVGACQESAGRTCGQDADCTAAPCIDGICCEGACSGGCMSCSSDQTGGAQGQCLPVLAGGDPRAACPGVIACDGAGSCFNKGLGASCVDDYECASGFCVDGVCCATGCTSTCYACDAVDTVSDMAGTCFAVLNGKDPGQECSGGATCNGGGACWAKQGGAVCGADYECVSGVCSSGVCVAVEARVAAGANHTCAIIAGGALKCWGRNSEGQLGLGDTSNRGDTTNEMGDALPVVNLGVGRSARFVAAGERHTCAILDNGQVKCWGLNLHGQLGLGDKVTRGDGSNEMGDYLAPVSLGTGRTARAIGAGSGHTCALLDNGQVKCWGRNDLGQLGLGDGNHRGDAAGEMGDSLASVSLGTGRSATSVAVGGFFTCVRLDTAQSKCWGRNAAGQLGLGDTSDRGITAGAMGDALPTVSLGSGRSVTAISTGWDHACVILDSGQVKCWGNNASGQLGMGDIAARGDAPGEMGNFLPLVDLGAGYTAKGLAGMGSSSCALLADGEAKCWGLNNFGQLGQGDIVTRGDDPAEMGDQLQPILVGEGVAIQALSAGQSHVCAVLDNTGIKCWGRNTYGQLGLEDSIDRGDGAGEMEFALPFVNL